MGRQGKTKKNLGRRCPECEVGFLETIFHKKMRDGVEYTEEFIECSECDYHQKISKKRDKVSLEDSKW
jgi:hypothetical protein